MSTNSAFYKATEKYFRTLTQYVPIVARVHGEHHPEFHEVRRLFDEINKKTKEAGSETPNLDEEFAMLREITDQYSVPGDVCESYEAVYDLLAKMDAAYHA